jgi:hypothetical protein
MREQQLAGELISFNRRSVVSYAHASMRRDFLNISGSDEDLLNVLNGKPARRRHTSDADAPSLVRPGGAGTVTSKHSSPNSKAITNVPLRLGRETTGSRRTSSPR